MRIIPLLLVSLSLLASDDFLNLAEDLDNASKISTKTKLNINKSPAVVSVLHASELEKLGITDVYTALETVPGIEVSMGIGGAKQINMRGNKSLVTDKLKFMIDGVSMNPELNGANFIFLNMPIENVERIEVIRGPSSALYGSFAHIGVINIITKLASKKKNVLFVHGSSEHSTTTGFTQHIDTKKIQLALSASFVDNNKQRDYYNYSLMPKTQKFTSYEDFTTKSFSTQVKFLEDFSFTLRYLEQKNQNYYGYGAWPIVEDPKQLTETSFTNELVYAPSLSDDLKLNLKLGYKTYSMIGEARIAPTQPYNLIGDGTYREKTFYTDTSLHYSLNNHDIILGTYLSETTANDTSYYINNIYVSEATTISIPGGGLVDNIKRDQYAFYINDTFQISQNVSSNIGLRYDYYSDADAAYAPKLSLLYTFDEKQSYKLMAQRSFRTPSFAELYGTQAPFIGDKNLKSETIDTYEIAYRYQDSFNSWFGVNFFYSNMKNFIYRDPQFTFQNGGDSLSYGSEIEFKLPIYAKTILQANYSYVHMEDDEGKEVPLSANHLANFMLTHQLAKNWSTGTKIRYVGKRSREEADTRDDLKSYTTFDQTLTFTQKSLTLQASVKNLFNADVRYPAPLGNGVTSGTYEDDLQRDGRVLWLSAKWNFK